MTSDHDAQDEKPSSENTSVVATTQLFVSATAPPSTVAKSAVALPSRIRVVVRVRPRLSIEQSHSCTILCADSERNLVHCGASTSTNKSFQFDQVFDGQTTQNGFYDQLKMDRMLDAVLDGYHTTVFAYGQTGSGKTFTMEGYDYERPRDMNIGSSGAPQARFDTSDRIGLIPRVIFKLFEHIARSSSREFVVKCSFLQIYNEQILDLLNPAHFLQPRSRVASKLPVKNGNSRPSSQQGLRLRWSAVRDFYVENLRVMECSSPQQVLQHFQDGIKHKIMASHNLNAASSRSHCIFTLYVESVDAVSSPNEILQSKLALVDLAGSERVDKTGATGVTLRESIGINKSLFVLRQVIQALSEEGSARGGLTDVLGQEPPRNKERAYIPYRDSKLTSLLKYSLGGNSWTMMIACLSPSDAYVDENMSTLLYASKAQSIANTPVKNEDPKTVLIHELRQEVESLRRQLAQAQNIILQFRQVSPSAIGSSESANEPPSTTSSNSTEPVSVEKPLPSVPETVEIKSSQIPATNTKLKMKVIDNVELIKQLYTTEKQLTDRVRQQEVKIADVQHETRVLQVENQSLREKMEVLEYLLATQKPENSSNDQDEADIMDIPEYGSLSTSASDPLVLTEPSTIKMRAVTSRVSTKGANQTPPTRPAPRQSPSSNQEKPPTSRHSNKAKKTTARQDGDTGLLSLTELRDLLGGKKVATPSTAAKQSENAPPTRNTMPRTPAAPIEVEQHPAVAILTTLEREKLM
ncbi:hypothetical protein Poli38472_009366 [Pythium oligandrum]|uniref:Kinesin-like protein n=1 Tax=Pythium oligandrum TaxID=41045 RepID=A0A8K1CKH4_PYTOL|nr:hypothetical protein Poli38472_009366 [Pythium oligandrum]|eukprot:TMW65199.1 hypothetical protein Poli38472_009366 [Pythium oligandrum]